MKFKKSCLKKVLKIKTKEEYLLSKLVILIFKKDKKEYLKLRNKLNQQTIMILDQEFEDLEYIKTLIKTDKSFLTVQKNPEIEELLEKCVDEVKGKLEVKPEIKIFGKVAHQKRDVGFFSDKSIGYRYSGNLAKSKSLTPFLSELLDKVNNIYGAEFNGILVNYYQDGNNTIGAHSDEERNLDKIGVISVSFGATRIFRIKNKKTGEKVKDIPMIQGELLHMGGDFQKEFTHEIPTEKSVKKERYSFTFRKHLE
jgi:alkylated DNA repair dioxygenase AlkB